MKTRLGWLTAVLLLQCNVSWAGGSTGGGYGVVCEDALTKSLSVRLLDYYESELLMPNLSLDLGSGANEVDLALNVVDRLKALDPERGKTYAIKIREFLSETHFVNANVPEIKDHGFVTLESGCSLKQVAVQNLIPIPEGKKFTINRSFWEKLSERDRAGLILHEIIYEEALALGQRDSRNSRYYNALISSKEVTALSSKEYRNRLAAVGLPELSGASVGSGISFPNLFTNATENESFVFDLSRFVVASTGAPLTFSVVNGPDWLSVNLAGVMTGIPSSRTLGKHLFQVRVTDGVRQITGEVTIRVIRYLDTQLPHAFLENAFSFDTLQAWPFETVCSDLSAKVINGPQWFSVLNGKGTVLGGEPTFKDGGIYSVLVELEQNCKGQIQNVRVRYHGVVAKKTSATGTVLAKDFDEVVRLSFSGSSCTGVLVGPEAVLTVGYCVTASGPASFEYRGAAYQADFKSAPGTPYPPVDLAIGVVRGGEVKGADPLNVGASVKQNDAVEVLTFEKKATAVAGPLISHAHTVNGVSRERIIHEHLSGETSVGYGDSGAPVIIGRRNKSVAGLVHSATTDSPQQVYSVDLSSSSAVSYLKSAAADRKVKVCGITGYCN
jgi:hypothetical protein